MGKAAELTLQIQNTSVPAATNVRSPKTDNRWIGGPPRVRNKTFEVVVRGVVRNRLGTKSKPQNEYIYIYIFKNI